MPPSPRADHRPLDAEILRAWPLPNGEDDDKLGRGTVLVIGGTASTPGAVVLAGVAALRMGAGRLQIATTSTTAIAVATAVPEAAVFASGAPGDQELSSLDARAADALAAADAVVVGSGTYAGSATTELLDEVLRGVSRTAVVVIDAGALACFAGVDVATRQRLAGRLVVTPNHQEVDRLARGGGTAADCASVAVELGAVVTSFGEVCAPDDRRWRVGMVTPGLGTSGSGDVLAGLVGGAAARGGDPAQAACWATFVHHDAGCALAARTGPIGYLARELADEAPASLARLAA